MGKEKIERLGTDLEALLKLQAAFLTTRGNGWREYNCAHILNEKVLEIMDVLAKEIGKEHATRFFNKKFEIAESLNKENPQVLSKINKLGQSMVSNIIEYRIIRLDDLREINKIK